MSRIEAVKTARLRPLRSAAVCWCLQAILAVLGGGQARAETGYDGWLRYAPIEPALRDRFASVPRRLVLLGDSPVLRTARDETVRGLTSMLGEPVVSQASRGGEAVILLGVLDRVRASVDDPAMPSQLRADGFWLGRVATRQGPALVVAGQSDRGVLYGAFALLRRIAMHADAGQLDDREEPSASIRWVNHWDNLDGTIERGYAGRSIFFDNGRVVQDLTRVRDYARLLSSVGINGLTINNVNANPQVITDAFLPQLARVADVLRPWGISLSVSIDFSSPTKIGGLDTFDPLDPRVAAFWKDRVDAIYRAVPDLGGVVLKADSEGRLGPSAYGRTHADAANVIARALAPRGGLIFYRGFVYDHLMDWRNPKNDRARAAYDNFHALDGQFDANVVVQIKHGPIDFQVREPPSPLFGALPNTNKVIELQITQEYLGQQRHVCFIVPMWKRVLDFDLQVKGTGTPVKSFVSGRLFGRRDAGFVGVSNIGRDVNWLGHDLAMANLYGFGRLAWNPDLPSREIAEEWTKLTFNDKPLVVEVTVGILLESWPTYEQYTGPLGAGTLTDIIGVHYGPGIESSERNGWGQWHRANGTGIGMDRTVATGTGFVSQYSPAVAAMLESRASTPEELLLFFHHVPYTYKLRSGETVIQYIYNSHYQGAMNAAAFVERWRRLEPFIDPERFASVLAKLEYQAGHAIVWRDAVTSWFRWVSGIPDATGRRLPGRVEAESMTLDRFAVTAVTPWETASGAQAAVCAAGGLCVAHHRFQGTAGLYDIAVGYFDENDGEARYGVSVGARRIDSWVADGQFGSASPNGHTATRHTVRRVTLKPGDEIMVDVNTTPPDGGAFDYIEIVPARD
ncbi:MAG TPA: alpha-glucuronidase family glycosyl hydrolase [Vicinamibacterales bacterium]|nr:alpha-glucuronidase family glycosyl hydrolase [Vicinamibacterales bacterium]